MANRVMVKTIELTEGMRIDQDVLTSTGLLLIARGTELDSFAIESISRLGLEGVYIRISEEEAAQLELNNLEKARQNADERELNLYDESFEQKKHHPPIPERVSPLIERTIEKISVADRAKVELSELVKERAAKSIEYLFGNTNAPDFAEKTNGVTQDLMRAILENDAVAVDIGVLKICDEYTFRHCVDVAAISMMIGKTYGMNNQEVYDLGIAGLLHDIGKSFIPKEILNKPAKLNQEEYTTIKRHSYYSYDVVKGHSEFNDSIKFAILEHHEKLNGTGYPLQLTSEKISVYARILAIADIYDALVTDRPYKKAYPKRDAIEIIMSMTQELDINVMNAFLRCVLLYPVGTNVFLSSGEWARVVENDPRCILRPKVVGITTGRVYDLANDLQCANVVIMD